MDVIQVRMPRKMIQQIDKEVSKGAYATRSDYVRQTLREQRRLHEEFVRDLKKLRGIIPNTGESAVDQVRRIRQQLSKEPIDVDEINGSFR